METQPDEERQLTLESKNHKDNLNNWGNGDGDDDGSEPDDPGEVEDDPDEVKA